MNWQSSGNDDCCSKGIAAGFCGVGEGDCDEDSDCAGSLVCGSDNCPWGDGDDCCMHPGMHVHVTTGLVPKNMFSCAHRFELLLCGPFIVHFVCLEYFITQG